MPRPEADGAYLGLDARLCWCEIQELVPVRVYLLYYRLLIGTVLARHLRRRCIPGLLRQALQELVGCYLHMLGHEAVSCVLARLVGARYVSHALQQRGAHRPDFLGRRGACTHSIQSLAHPPLVLL